MSELVPASFVRRALASACVLLAVPASTAVAADGASIQSSTFATAGEVWSTPVLPSGATGSSAAWENTLAGV